MKFTQFSLKSFLIFMFIAGVGAGFLLPLVARTLWTWSPGGTSRAPRPGFIEYDGETSSAYFESGETPLD